MNLKISIALATYNGEKFLKEQLDSYALQTHPPDELVVCDDGSTDKTTDILEAFAITAPFEVRIIQNDQNLGYVRNFEKVISLCRGDIICLSDQDDVWLPEKLHVIHHRFVWDNRIKIVACDMILTNELLVPSGRTLLENALEIHQDLRSFSYGCGTAISQKFLDVLLPFPSEYFSHDGWIHDVAIAMNIREIDRSTLQFYRRHAKNASNTSASRERLPTILDILKEDGLKDVSDGWKLAIDRIEILLQRLDERSVVIDRLGLVTSLNHARIVLGREISDRNRRIAIVARPRTRRPPAIARLWLTGGYSYFAGWKSAVKDLIRP